MGKIPLSYEYERDDFYCYPDSKTLRNKLGIKDEKTLDDAEREITGLKAVEFVSNPFPEKLDFNYIKKLHKFLFQDIYDWAGEIRTIDISKGNIFCQHELIEINAEVLLNELESEHYLVDTSDNMAERLAYYLGDLNSIHPFREGNGRVQRLFIAELARRAGYSLDFSNISPREMIIASDEAFRHNYEPLEEIIQKSLIRK
ncbi:Fic family protein [Candidatus Saccharibacteria bacterium]|nr:Fic family protein [Candidatus Saccharibacteria bacterium]